MAVLKQYSLQIALVILAFGFVFSILGVYGTSELPFYMRITFWTVTMATGILMTVIAMPVLVNRVMKEHHPIVQVMTGALLASFPVTFVLTVFNPRFNFESSLKVWAIQFGYVLIISIIVGSVGYPYLKKMGVYGDVQTSESSNAAVFLKRLPPKFHSAELYGFSAEDHYLRVYTDKGEALILLRFADALRDLLMVDGLQVHRSWWVMKAGVVDVQTQDRKKVLVLESGVIVPISRTFMKSAKEAFSF